MSSLPYHSFSYYFFFSPFPLFLKMNIREISGKVFHLRNKSLSKVSCFTCTVSMWPTLSGSMVTEKGCDPVTVSALQQFTNKLGVEALEMSTSLLKPSSN